MILPVYTRAKGDERERFPDEEARQAAHSLSNERILLPILLDRVSSMLETTRVVARFLRTSMNSGHRRALL